MGRFAYRALDSGGRAVSGTLDADSSDAAAAVLAARGLIPTRVTAQFQARPAGGGRGVKPMEMAVFTKQFSTMLRAGVPMVKVLEILESQTENARLKSVAGLILRDVRDGSSLSAAMRKYPRVFPALYLGMVRAGEASGSLPQVMDRLIYLIEHEAKVKSDVKSALQYPLIVLAALVLAFFVLLWFVVPKFAAVFQRAGMTLPLPTRICLGLSGFLQSYWLALLVAVTVLGFGLYAVLRTAEGRFVRDSFLMRMPLVGPLLKKAAISRFASVFAILQSSGIPILETMRVISDTIGNAAVERELGRIQDMLQEGRGIARPLGMARCFTPMLVNMVAVGEETGNLEEMLREVARHYDSEVEYATKKLGAAIGPTLIVALAAVVGFFALAIYMPMWDMAKAASAMR